MHIYNNNAARENFLQETVAVHDVTDIFIAENFADVDLSSANLITQTATRIVIICNSYYATK